MTTTAIFAEILAIGIQTVIVLGVGLAALVDIEPIMGGVESWTALATITVLAIALSCFRCLGLRSAPRDRVSEGGQFLRSPGSSQAISEPPACRCHSPI
jgi:hypothetical protein